MANLQLEKYKLMLEELNLKYDKFMAGWDFDQDKRFSIMKKLYKKVECEIIDFTNGKDCGQDIHNLLYAYINSASQLQGMEQIFRNDINKLKNVIEQMENKKEEKPN